MSDGTRPGDLTFTVSPVDNEGSVAYLFNQTSGRTGIYLLEFTNGKAYVGQSRNVTNRLATHRRRWRGQICSIGFAACPLDSLDAQESAMIWELDRQGRSLENKKLTKRPAGVEPLPYTTQQGQPLMIPWEREARGRLTRPHWTAADESTVSARHQAKYEQLQANDVYPTLISALATLIDEAVPSPIETAQVLWTLSALPSTRQTASRRRLATLNAGRLEIAFFNEHRNGAQLTHETILNVAPPRDKRRFQAALHTVGLDHTSTWVHDYSHETHVQVIWVPDLGLVEDLLADPYIADLAYQLIVQYLRLGSNPLRRHHNHLLTNDVFHHIAEDRVRTSSGD